MSKRLEKMRANPKRIGSVADVEAVCREFDYLLSRRAEAARTSRFTIPECVNM
jgi:hypothetical protein